MTRHACYLATPAAAIGALLLGGGLIALPAQALEVKAFAISDFVPGVDATNLDGEGCGGADRGSWDNMVDAWYEEMDDRGHTRDGEFYDGNMTIQRFCDPDAAVGIGNPCDDHLFVDEADVAMFATHGTDSGDHWAGQMRARWQGHCFLDGGGTGDEMHLGDVDLEFFHLSSCNSADQDNLPGIRHALHDPVDGGYAHQWNGFHGVMWIYNFLPPDYEDFAADAHASSIARAWVLNHYYSDDFPADCSGADCVDQCPVSYAISNTRNTALARLKYERYNNVFSDPTGNNWYAYMYIEGCDPIGEDAFIVPD